MRVRVHEARHHHAAPRVEHLAPVSDERLYLTARADALDAPAADEHRAVRDDGKLPHLGADARARGAAQRDELRAVDDGQRNHKSEVSESEV